MKKFAIVLLLLIGSSFNSNAQVNEHALGARFVGESLFIVAEASYQYGFNQRNRLEIDAGTGRSGGTERIARAAVIFHWDWNLFLSFNFYVGPGVQAGFYWDGNVAGPTLAAGGQAGLEFDFKKQFNVPILASLDVRPMFDFLHPDVNAALWLPGGALSVRYIF